MRIGVSPADQVLARLDVELAERLGESVDPGIKMIADVDLSGFTGYPGWSVASGGRRRTVVWLDMETGEVVDPTEDAQATAQASSNGSTSEEGPSDSTP